MLGEARFTESHLDILISIHEDMQNISPSQTAYVNTLQRLSDAYSEDAETKYNHFITHHNQLTQRMPQYLIASYLGILPSSLSRIRNKKLRR